MEQSNSRVESNRTVEQGVIWKRTKYKQFSFRTQHYSDYKSNIT